MHAQNRSLFIEYRVVQFLCMIPGLVMCVKFSYDFGCYTRYFMHYNQSFAGIIYTYEHVRGFHIIL